MIITQGTKTRRKWHKFPLYQVPKIPLNSPHPLADPWLSQNFMHHMTSHDNTWHHNPHVSVTLVLSYKAKLPWCWLTDIDLKAVTQSLMCQMSQVLKSDTAHISQTKLCLPLVISWLIAGWKEVLPACSLTLKYQLFMSHRASNVTCHKCSKKLNKVKKSWIPSSPPRPSWRLAGWQLTEGAHRDWLLPGSQLVRLSPHPPPPHTSLTISTLFHGGSLRFPQDSCLNLDLLHFQPHHSRFAKAFVTLFWGLSCVLCVCQ